MNYYTEITRDRREILAVWSAFNDDVNFHTVGTLGVTKIDAYDENGEMSHIPFIAVYKGDFLAYRIPANSLSIRYKESAE